MCPSGALSRFAPFPLNLNRRRAVYSPLRFAPFGLIVRCVSHSPVWLSRSSVIFPGPFVSRPIYPRLRSISLSSLSLASALNGCIFPFLPFLISLSRCSFFLRLSLAHLIVQFASLFALVICLFCNSPAISLSAHSLSISCLAAGSGSQRHYQPRKPSTGLLFGRYATLIIQRDDRRMDSWNVFAPLLCFGPLTAPLIPKHKRREREDQPTHRRYKQ